MWKEIFDDIEEKFLVWTIAISVLLTFSQVIMRYAFHNSLSWSEELSRYLFLWYSWIGASYCVKEKAHLRVGILTDKLLGRKKAFFEIVILLVWIVFSIFLAWQGGVLTGFLIKRGQLSAAMRIPMSIAYSSVPVGCFLMALRLIFELPPHFKKLFGKEV
ncbi:MULTISPECIES: TRAP transporter small permease [Dethiosulfovibrio]|uniref:TRAP transporter small permease n=2 Tax=Dethiosulfovibrio TaxID=47054 RepID=A0ABS9ENB4_9BACT|nr:MULTISPECIES: TRAP transporter small permease [Dethiosulfovibrio]MCF4114137.1 TRAP transporter small permease [Dethiosulfovibrio russensis]MCF4142673.1 TRAP transporter small permease [Dethiosulfovibrio marinus]MCF4144763.1 TRAP transporter small permease [Dethiosulfovibrio acidaminovorans]